MPATETFDQFACIIGGSRQLADQAGELEGFSISFLLISLPLAGSWFFCGDTVVIIGETPSRSSLTHKLPDTLNKTWDTSVCRTVANRKRN